MGLSVIVLENHSSADKSVSEELSSPFQSILANSSDELRERIAADRPNAVILDMEYSRLSDVRNLHEDFPFLPIVCTHRVPDEALWIAALEAGASDVCHAEDVQNVLTLILQNVPGAKAAFA